MRYQLSEPPPCRSLLETIEHSSSEHLRVKDHPALSRRLVEAIVCEGTTDGEELTQLSSAARLKRNFGSDGGVIFAGAGVSVGSGVPNWKDLAERVFERLANLKLNAPPEQLFEIASRCAPDPATYFRTVYEVLTSLMSPACINEIPKKICGQLKWERWQCLRDRVNIENPVLGSLGNLVVCGNSRNPLVHGVVTTNVDNLLEIYCQAICNGRKLTSRIDRSSFAIHPDKTPISHLHGCLDFRGEVFMDADVKVPEVLPDLVFTSSEYSQTEADPYSFRNYIPVSMLRAYNCIFVGMSMQDANIRRWLRFSFNERVKHRAAYLRSLYSRPYKGAEIEARIESVRHFWLRYLEEGQPKGDDSSLKYEMKAMGVAVIDCKGANAISKAIDELAEMKLERRGLEKACAGSRC